jgi:hypothetical protein
VSRRPGPGGGPGEPARVRAYVATTGHRLREAVEAGELGPAPLRAHAVTAALRAELANADEEEWEYAACAAAAQASLDLLAAGSGDDPPRRVVVAVDAPRAQATAAEDPTAVRLDEPVPMARVAAVLADSADAAGAVAAARDALRSGAPDAGRLAARCLDHELGWWATQEVDVLLAEVSR